MSVDANDSHDNHDVPDPVCVYNTKPILEWQHDHLLLSQLDNIPATFYDTEHELINWDTPGVPLNSEFFSWWLTEQNLDNQVQDLIIAHRVIKTGVPNRWGLRIPLSTNWNIELLDSLLKDYHDWEIVEWLKFGFPISYDRFRPDPVPNNVNHKGAECFPSVIDEYVEKELREGSTMGPFMIPPFLSRNGISPLSTREKRGSSDRRVIMDLSFRHNTSVNDGISRDNYMGTPISLRYPSIDTLAARVAQLGPSCALFKLDLARYFRQIPVCPLDYSLLGWRWRNLLFYDKSMPMGLRSAAYVAQRISSSIVYIHSQMGYFSINYLDDFGSAEPWNLVWDSFNALRRILQQVGLKESTQKAVLPTTKLTFLGVFFDTDKMTLEVSKDRIAETIFEIEKWERRSMFTRKNLESLIGKLQFISNCVRGSRVFISRLLTCLTGTERKQLIPIDTEMRKDIAWWKQFMTQYNGVSIMWHLQLVKPNQFAASDACLVAAGGWCDNECYHLEFPAWVRERTNNIAHFEFLALLVTLKLWKRKLSNKFLVFLCDNQAVCHAVNAGLAKDAFLLQCLREVAWLCCTYDFYIRLQYIESARNLIPDLLSRMSIDRKAKLKFHKLNSELRLKMIDANMDLLNLSSCW